MENLTSYYYTPQPPQRLAPPPPPPPLPLHRINHHHAPLPPSPPASLHRLDHHQIYLPPPHSPPSRDDEVRTLFIAGLPEDVKDREIYHIFLEFPGFLHSHLRHPSGDAQAFAFAEFTDQQSAVAAMCTLNGMVFDLEKGSTLHIELAKSNSRSKRRRIDDERSDLMKKQKTSLTFPRGSVDSGLGSLHIPGMDNSHNNMVGYPSAQSHLNVDHRGVFDTSGAQSSNSISSTIAHDRSPCPTIFVANLGSNCSEQELQQIFSRCRGFLNLKFQRSHRSPVAFVDFQDTACSTEAMIRMQGTVLRSSPAGGEGMHLEYAKSRMGMRRRKSK